MTVEIGRPAPDFTLKSDSGEKIKLSSFRGKKVILYFYPEDDSPGCTQQACDFRDNFAAIQGAAATVLGISPDSVESHSKFKEKYHLNFPLLSDPDHKVAEKYGAWGEKNNYGRKYMGILRSHFVIDENGKVIDIRRRVPAKDSMRLALASLQSK
jgi:peroxiredoxin Q/BCP